MWIPLCFYYMPYIGASYLVTIPFLFATLYLLYKKDIKKVYFYGALGLVSWLLYALVFWYTQSYIDSKPRLDCETSTNITLVTMLGLVAIIYTIVLALLIKRVDTILSEGFTKILFLAYILSILIPAVYLSSYEVRGSRFEVADVIFLLPVHTVYYLYEGKLLDA